MLSSFTCASALFLSSFSSLFQSTALFHLPLSVRSSRYVVLSLSDVSATEGAVTVISDAFFIEGVFLKTDYPNLLVISEDFLFFPK